MACSIACVGMRADLQRKNYGFLTIFLKQVSASDHEFAFVDVATPWSMSHFGTYVYEVGVESSVGWGKRDDSHPRLVKMERGGGGTRIRSRSTSGFFV